MRFRVRWLVPVAILVSFVCGMARLCQTIGSPRTLPGTGRFAANNLSQSQAHALLPGRWLELRLPADAEVLRILTNANSRGPIPEHQRTDGTPSPFRYSLRYELCDQQNTIRRGVYHFRSPPQITNPISNRTDNTLFYASCSLVPAPTRAMHLPIDRLNARPSSMRIRIDAKDPEIEDICVRVYARQRRHGYDRPYVWARTSANQKRKLARSQVFAPELLSPAERRELLKRQWLPLAPDGMEGTSFQRRSLYSLDRAVSDPVEPEMPAGLFVAPDVVGVVPLPSQPGTVRLEKVAKTGSEVDCKLLVSLFGRASQPTAKHRYQVDENPWSIELPVEGSNLLELEATGELVLRVQWTSAATFDGKQDITPSANPLRMYQLVPRQNLNYRVAQVNQLPTPMRISVRSVVGRSESKGLSLSPVKVHWRLLDEHKAILDAGQLVVRRNISRYDRLSESHSDRAITDPESFFFSVPPGGRTLQLETEDEAVLVAAFTRPPDLAKVTRIPHDYAPFHGLLDGQPTWFVLRPTDHPRLMESDRSLTVCIQARPPEYDPEIAAGRYQWQDYHPRGDWTGHHVLAPRSRVLPIRDQAVATTFVELPLNKNTDLKFRTDLRHESSHRLVFSKLSDEVAQVRVFRNDMLWKSQAFHGRHGQWQIPRLGRTDANQTERIRIEADEPMRVFMNYTHAEHLPLYLKRLATRLEGTSMSFDYRQESSQEAALLLYVYEPADAQPLDQLEVSIRGTAKRSLGPHKSWTLMRRVFRMTPALGEPVVLLSDQAPRDYVAHKCFIPLGADLSAGSYTIQVQVRQPGQRYLVLSRTTAGNTSSIEMWYELPRHASF